MPDALVDAVVAASTEAGELAMAHWQGDFRRWEKASGDPVCEVDLAVDLLLRQRLEAIDPSAGWLSEETADDRSRLDRSRVWIVDPIDGTRDYVRGRPGWAISVALVKDGQPQIGVLVAPARQESWVAAAGRGATRNGRSVRVSDQAGLEGARVPTDAAPKWLPQGVVRVAKPNSIALRIALVAGAEADFIATARWGADWDIAAAALIAAEAGAQVTDAHGAPIRFNSSDAAVFGVIAAPPPLHAEVLAVIRRRAANLAAGSR